MLSVNALSVPYSSDTQRLPEDLPAQTDRMMIGPRQQARLLLQTIATSEVPHETVPSR